ncbi:hypothetical protein [Brevibacillus reuszeri]|uniref:hypothetical protein n=1 Tax=Brevibacillus reuszeri TaxID=54915 RepID=UPI00289DB889|nr:hypothetical protein [Brevibacillus reuszeri]
MQNKIAKQCSEKNYIIQKGLDLAQIDGRIEVNYDFPSHALFAKLKDKTYFRTIKRLHFQYRNRVKTKRS